MSDNQDKVKDFMVRAGQETPDQITIPDEKTRILKIKCLLEEVLELAEASGVSVINDKKKVQLEDFNFQTTEIVDIIEVADALVDIEYFLLGTGVAYGIKLQNVFDEVHRSNMEKFGPGSYKREDGKWVKPPNWKKPNIREVLIKQS